MVAPRCGHAPSSSAQTAVTAIAGGVECAAQHAMRVVTPQYGDCAAAMKNRKQRSCAKGELWACCVSIDLACRDLRCTSAN